MRIKNIVLMSMIILFSNSYSEKIKADTDEVTVDLNTNVMTAKNGIYVNSNNISGLFYEMERDPQTGIVKFSNNALLNINQDSGNIKIETERGIIDNLKEKGEFFNNFAYINVAKTTGAEAPNDKIYFGTPYLKYENEKIYLKDGWITTDFNIVNYPNNPTNVGYHLYSKEALIEPDKQITLYNTDLFIGKKDIVPFSLPWFRANIRKNSKVPLFPTFTSSHIYGFETMWGVLYGDKKDKFRGGISPKFADRMGFLIGRWENWYKSDLGETKLNIDDLLVYSKEKKLPRNYSTGDLINYEKRHKRYKISLDHIYEDKKGYFYFNGTNSTKSMIGKLTDIMEKMDNNSLYETFKINREKYDKNIGFYKLKSDLKELGEDKDLSLKIDTSLVSDKKTYALMVYDSIDDIGYGSSIDHDLYSNLSLKKDNANYKLSAKYNYLYDMDPGSTASDLQSRDETVGINFSHKNTGIGLNYDKRRGDDYRKISLWEKDIKTKLKQNNLLGLDFNYVPTTVSKYKINNKENLELVLGNYKIGNYSLIPSFKYLNFEKRLDLIQDEYRKGIFGDNRLSNYNRFEDIIYNKKIEKRIDLDLKNIDENYRVSLGETKEEITDRTGLYDGSSKNFINDSNFYEIMLEKKKIKTSNKTSFDIATGYRLDEYKNSSDKLGKFNLKIANDLNIYNRENLKIDNNLKLELQKYGYSGKNKNKESRLINKNDFIEIGDTVSINNKNTVTTLKTNYKESRDPYGKKNLNNRIFKNEVSVKFDDNKNIKVFLNENKRYLSKTISQNKFNDLSNRDYGINLNFERHSFTASNLNIKYNVDDVVSPIKTEENITENNYSYSYKRDNDKITLNYAEGKNKSKYSLNTLNREYSVLYNTFDEKKEQDIFLGYSQNYYDKSEIKNDIKNTDTYKFSYEYRDKNFENRELLKYATLEYEKSESEITSYDIEKIKNILDRNRDFNREFEFTRISDETFKIGNYKKSFKFYSTIEKNNRRYSQTGNLKDSMSKLEGGLSYTYNRLGIGYKFTEKSDWKLESGNYSWKKNSKEHTFDLYAKIGKPSQSWKIKTYLKFYENLEDKAIARKNNKKPLDGIGIEIGKEMGYYEWAVSYENKYSPNTRDYEWRAGIHFTLLTFPSNSLFGFGAKNRDGVKTRPTSYLLNRPEELNKKDN